MVSDRLYTKDRIGQQVLDLFSGSDLNIVNLESPVTYAGISERIIKTGPYLKGEEGATAEVLKALKIGLVTLANNHILDYGRKGISHTLSFCKNNRIETVGAGMNLSEAQQPFRFTIKGKRISIINFAENEWASAKEDTPGANPMDLIDNVNQIKTEKEFSDIVIVVVHGGHEHYSLPSPRMVKQYRFYAENGADLIVGHHPHCVSGYEIYKEVPIYYSIGNFLFTRYSTFQDWYQGLLLEINISPQGKISTNFHPVEQKLETYDIEVLGGKKKKDFMEKIDIYSNIIRNEAQLGEAWKGFINKKTPSYLQFLSPLSSVRNTYLRKIFNKLNISNRFLNVRGVALTLNLMRCEAHADVLKEVARKFVINHEKTNDYR